MPENPGAAVQERPRLTTGDRVALHRGMQHLRGGDGMPSEAFLLQHGEALSGALEKAIEILQPRCRSCGRTYSAQEADAGYTTCERCSPDVSTPEAVAQRVAFAMNQDPLFVALVIPDQLDWVHLETAEGDEFILEVQPAVTPGTGSPMPVSAEELRNLLELWGHPLPLAVLQQWSPGVLDRAARYVAAAIAHANDHELGDEDWPELPAELEQALGFPLPHPARARFADEG